MHSAHVNVLIRAQETVLGKEGYMPPSVSYWFPKMITLSNSDFIIV